MYSNVAFRDDPVEGSTPGTQKENPRAGKKLPQKTHTWGSQLRAPRKGPNPVGYLLVMAWGFENALGPDAWTRAASRATSATADQGQSFLRDVGEIILTTMGCWKISPKSLVLV